MLLTSTLKIPHNRGATKAEIASYAKKRVLDDLGVLIDEALADPKHHGTIIVELNITDGMPVYMNLHRKTSKKL